MNKPWRLGHTKQCDHCPWRKDVDPFDIPNGYSVEKHAALSCTIARPGIDSLLQSGPRHVMACHETHEDHCIGWLMNQVGSGNNIGMRLAVRNCENFKDVELVGEQHERFEDTLPCKPA
jgi:hypothetical protein